MAIAALSLAGFSRYTSASSNIAASQRTLQALQSAINSGNLRTAQNALIRYQSLNKNLSVKTGSTTGDAQISASLTPLGKAIGSANVSASKTAFAAFQSSIQSNPLSPLAAARAGDSRALSQVQGLLSALVRNSSSTGLNLYA